MFVLGSATLTVVLPDRASLFCRNMRSPSAERPSSRLPARLVLSACDLASGHRVQHGQGAQPFVLGSAALTVGLPDRASLFCRNTKQSDHGKAVAKVQSSVFVTARGLAAYSMASDRSWFFLKRRR
jgi:hypothetical protein